MFQNPWYGQVGGQAADDGAVGNPPTMAAAALEVQTEVHTEAAASDVTNSAEGEDPGATSLHQSKDPIVGIQRNLKSGWTVHVVHDGRLFYCNHINQTSSWLPPIDNWNGSIHGVGVPLPYGWEAATDREGKAYFINHLNKTTTYEDPRKDWSEEPPQPREVELTRHPELGFGFVAGSEKPVIVRFVTEGGPSVDKLLPGDQIWRINGEDVKNAPRDHVIQLVRACKETVSLSVCQPPLDNSARKSALLSAAKKAKLKTNPSRVRFAEGVVINGTPPLPLSQTAARDGSELTVPLMPNVLKVYLENGQTKSFKYDSSTTVSDVLNSLQQKLGFKSMDHFSLCVEHVKSIRRNKLTLLDPAESLAWIAARPGAHNLRCLLRIAFVPKDAYDLLRRDTGAFDYLYMQCCNDVVQERFAPELKYDIALRIAALHMHQHALTNKMQSKFTVKNIEREYGLERFVPTSLVEAMKRKELRKLLSHFVKVNQQLTAPGQKQLTALQAKLHYLKIISDLPSYGAKCFSTNFKPDSNVETVILVSPKYGVSQISGLRNSTPLTLCNIEDVTSLNIRREDELTQYVEVRLKDPDKETLLLSLEERDAEELILVLRGYHKLLTDRALPVHRERTRWTQDSAPPYHTRHTVQPAPWSFLDLSSEESAADSGNTKTVRFADLSVPPPYHPPPEGFQIPNGPFVISSDQEDDGVIDGETAEDGFDDSQITGVMSVRDSPRSTARGVALALSPQLKLDNNMNKPLPNNNVDKTSNGRTASRLPVFSVRDSPRRVSTLETAVPSHKLGFDMPSVVSMEILESQVPSQADCSEARNDAVIQRVSELKRLVEDAEQYLTGGTNDADRNSRVSDMDTSSVLSDLSQLSKTESDLSSAYGRLRHSDSLLLLTQGQKQLSLPDNTTVILDSNEHASSSDTDSVNTPNVTPTHSPSQRPKSGDKATSRPPSMLKPSDSSFGLHSPDVLPSNGEEKDLEGLLRRLQDDPNLPFPFAEGTLYLDPDIIDLTMIPPPITPEEDGIKFPATLNEPPTPFADRETLENELSSAKGPSINVFNGHSNSDLGELKDLTDLAQWADVVSDTASLNESRDTESEDTLSLSGISTGARSVDSSYSASSSLTSLSQKSLTESKRRWIADEKRKYQGSNPELDKFLAQVAVPPPPGKTSSSSQVPSVSDFNDDFSAYIIPPPPTNVGSSTNNGLAILQKLYEAREGIFQVMSENSTSSAKHERPDEQPLDEKDRAIAEVRIRSEQRESGQAIHQAGVSRKIGEIQRLFTNGHGSQSSSFGLNSTNASSAADASVPVTKGTTPDLSPASSHSSGYGSLKSITECPTNNPPELPARVPTGHFSPRKNGYNNLKAPIMSRITGLKSLNFRPAVADDGDDDIPPPPPPPRNSIPRMVGSANSSPSRSPNKVPPQSKDVAKNAPPPPGVLTKSSSQGDLINRATASSTGRNLPNPKARGLSASTESISSTTRHPYASGTSSPSKLSMASSSDSLGSNVSVSTVKNMAAAVSTQDSTPPLPPRNSPTRVVMRPPLPSPSNQDPVKMGVNRTGMTSPSVNRRGVSSTAATPDSPPSPKPPALPSRLRKPTSPQKAPSKPVPSPSLVNGNSVRSPTGKPAAPPPPPSSSPPQSSKHSSHYAVPQAIKLNGSPTKRQSPTSPVETPAGNSSRLPRPTGAGPGAGPAKGSAPLLTSSPKISARANGPSMGSNVVSVSIRAEGTSGDKDHDAHTYDQLPNGVHSAGHQKLAGEDNGSLDSGSFEQDSLDRSTEVDLTALCSQSETAIHRVISRLSLPVPSNGRPVVNKDDGPQSEAARERLINESRQFVTASKMFVKSVTDSPQAMIVCLNQCVTLVEKMGQAAEDLSNRDLLPKVRDVARAFLHTLRAAAEACGQGVNDPSMGRLMGKATALAGVLTILMRSLRP